MSSDGYRVVKFEKIITPSYNELKDKLKKEIAYFV